MSSVSKRKQFALAAMLRRVWNYVAYERNPIVPLLYVSLMVWCKYAFVREAYPYLPNHYVHEYHKSIAAALFVACFALYIHMCRSDPGVITAVTVDHFHRYPCHPVLFPENKFCRTCKTPKLPRSKHCSVCNHCVARFDHQYVPQHLMMHSCSNTSCSCIWFNTCIGVHNYGAFVVFLLVQTALCLEILYVTSSVFIVQSEDIITSGASKTEYREALHTVISRNQPLGFVAAVTFMITIVLWFFLMMQLQRVTINATANESFKRDALRIDADPDSAGGAKKLFTLLVSTLPGNGSDADQLSRAERKKDLDTSWGGLFSPDTILNTEEKYTVADVNYNPYNLGSFWKNAQDAFQGRSSKPKVA